jgi:hypothetical protein
MAQDTPNPWNGSWNLDKASMKYSGSTFSVATDPDGYTVTMGGTARPKMLCNGQPNPPYRGLVTTCIKAGAGYQTESTRDGKLVRKAKIEPSADGKTIAQTIEITPPDGSSPYTITVNSKKVSAKGNTVVWKETGFTESQDTGVLSIQVNGDSIDFKETDNDKPITAKLDGTPAKFQDRTVSIKLDGPRTLKVTYLDSDGKMGRENTFVLSPNGKTIKETDVTPAPAASTMTVMFHKS